MLLLIVMNKVKKVCVLLSKLNSVLIHFRL